MKQALVMMYYTLIEGVRSRIFFIAVVFSVFLLLFTRALSALSFSEQHRLLFDFGMASLSFCVLLLAIYCGVVLFHLELQSRSLMSILSKPISRSQFIVGKYLGYLLVCFSIFCILLTVMAILFLTNDMSLGQHFPLAAMGIFFDVALALAILFLFSIVTNSFLALSFTVAVLLMGRSHQTVSYFAELKGDALMVGLDFFLKYFIPNFEVWNWKDRYYEVAAGADYNILLSFAHASLWIVVIVGLTALVFRRKDCV